MKKLYKTLSSKIKGNRSQNPSTTSSKPPAKKALAQGLKLIYESPNPIIDIVAIHGDGGHWQNSFTERETGVFWLRDLLPSLVQESRILSFSYEGGKTSTTPVQDVALGLIRDFGDLRSGGIALAASYGNPQDKSILDSTHAILFFGSPKNSGQGLAKLEESTAGDVSGSPHIAAMKRDLQWLQDSNAEYLQIESHVTTRYFLEAHEEGVLIPADSLVEDNIIPLSKTHGEIVRYSGADDEDFGKVSLCLKEMLPKF